jgi:isopenicillin-N epimerase
MASALAKHWMLDPSITFLNHGSFGACPRDVLARQREYIERMEAEPLKFLARDLEPLLDQAREELARFVGAKPADVVFVPNATSGVNAVLRSLKFQPGDELLTTSHAYNACKNALEFVAELHGANVVVATIPFPIQHAGQVTEAVLNAVTPRTRLFLLDHITSPTAMILPAQELVQALAQRGIDTLVDGAHAPGMIPLDITRIGAAYYAGNLHKWTCAPKGAGFLFVRGDKQKFIRPLAISHGANSRRTDRSRFHLEFDWTGTVDFSPYLCIPHAIRTLAAMVEGGWPRIMQHNKELALEARGMLCDAFNIQPLCPADMLGSIAAVDLPTREGDKPVLSQSQNPLQDALLFKHNIEVPLMPWPSRILRVSAQLYNDRSDYEKLVRALKEEL